jgi:hypothetical protein
LYVVKLLIWLSNIVAAERATALVPSRRARGIDSA